jgi:hypothetical protein
MSKRWAWLVLIVLVAVIVSAVVLGRESLWNFLLALHGKH